MSPNNTLLALPKFNCMCRYPFKSVDMVSMRAHFASPPPPSPIIASNQQLFYYGLIN